MNSLETKLKSVVFWLRLGVINHMVALVIVAFGCVYSGLVCSGEAMSGVLSVYTFTLFTPQVALEVILLLAIFLVSKSLRDFADNWALTVVFIVSLAAPILLIN